MTRPRAGGGECRHALSHELLLTTTSDITGLWNAGISHASEDSRWSPKHPGQLGLISDLLVGLELSRSPEGERLHDGFPA
jgi:hypothetical protein